MAERAEETGLAHPQGTAESEGHLLPAPRESGKPKWVSWGEGAPSELQVLHFHSYFPHCESTNHMCP